MLIKPHLQLDRVTDITVELLYEIKVDTLILDVDNTLCVKKGAVLLPDVLEWIKNMQSAGIKLIILSNAKPNRMSVIAKKFGLPFVALGLKPLPFGYWRAVKRMKSKIKGSAIIGDQLFTDMMGGHLAFCKTILVSPVELETSFGFKIKRGMERILLRLYKLKCDF